MVGVQGCAAAGSGPVADVGEHCPIRTGGSGRLASVWGVPALTRDRLTLLVYGHLAVYGYFLYGFGPTVSLAGTDLHISRAVAGLHGTALAAGAVLAGILGPRVVGRFGRGAALRGGLVGTAVGLTVYLLGTALPVTLAGALIAGSFGALLVNTHSVVLTQHHGAFAPAAISEANALATGLGILSPLIIGATVALGLGWRPGLALAVVAALVVLCLTARVPVGGPATSSPGDGRERTRLPLAFWLTVVVLVLCIGAEFSLTFWASELIRERTGAGVAASTGSVTALLVGMTVGRSAGAALTRRREVDWLLGRAVLLSGAGFVVFWVSTAFWLSIIGLALLGLGLSLQYPLAIGRVIAASDGRPDLATGRASIALGFAVGTAPFVLGLLADAIGTHRAFLLVPTLLAAAWGLIRVGRPRPQTGRNTTDPL